MSDYKQKYLKYKNKYLELKKMSGGVISDDFLGLLQKRINHCSTFEGINVYDPNVCTYCPFNNSGDNQNPNKCKPLTNHAESCFTNTTRTSSNQTVYNPFGFGTRMNIQKYLLGLSDITIENNIHVTPPLGEVCFGNAITSCLTYCVILDDNTKISVHVNPATTFFAINLNNQNVLQNEIVNVLNAHEKILEILKQQQKIIRKIIILGQYNYKVYDYNGIKFIGDETLSGTNHPVYYHTNPNISEDDEDYYNYFVAIDIPYFLNEVWNGFITPQTEIQVINGIDISNGKVYMVDSEGVGKIFDENNNLIRTI